ncbi:MAG: quinone-interacting membrane-bound oxidoreductase complex subunit QmoC [Deltaproteobacteria bacterium]|nr:quinone-interacting membrane-bound oxidoreductase complex subunit QmoC [Deltaproteobacteria bacterium]MBW2180006.1 quinone-interacting membrane-bound oxidoreductase complex subunit QmoC [Deltaproteobacteria bacterium]MBW2365678.1 quinone-interacting membrane-bound oxidoreductase complex subunit QmoC [Deltaproteobacteria bacterium]
MADAYMVEPDVGFIDEVTKLGGGDLKKCFQCATCSVACPISPENKPFPRKEMIAASWGLKDRLVGNADIWLCHNCGDCTALCPRGAKPGDVLGAIRSYAIANYAVPKALGRAVNDPKKLPILLAIPILLFFVVGLLTGLLNLTPEGGEIAHSKFFSTWLVDIFFIPLQVWVVAIFALGLKNFIKDIHENALLEGKTDKNGLDIKALVGASIKTVLTILKHDKFDECGENKDRSLAHMFVLFGFIGLFIVTAIFFFTLYVLQIHGPYSQMNPVKWLANIAGVSLVVGSILMIKNRLSKKDEVSSFKDWALIILAFSLGVTGMLSEITRLLGLAYTSYWIYFIHLVCVFYLVAYLPFSKLAHLVYRTTAMIYAEYSNRK